MSNFTKSVIYSTAVLAIGLVGIMAISGQRDGQEAAVAGIEPAAGDSDIGIDFSKTMNDAGADIRDIATEVSQGADEAVSASQEEMNKALEAVDEEVDNLGKPAADLSEGTPEGIVPPSNVESAESAPSEAAPANNEGVEKPQEKGKEAALGAAEDAASIQPAAGDLAEEAVDQAEGKIMDKAQDAADDLGLEE